MSQTFTINSQHQFNSIKEGLLILLWLPVGLSVAHLIGIEDYPLTIVIFLLFNLLFFLPVFYLHFTYFLYNRKTILTVDNYSKRISITKQDKTASFSYDDIHIVEQHLGIYHKNKIDHRGRLPMPWMNYGYLKLKLKNGKTFFLSSLMFDLIKPPLAITHTKYRFLPDLDRQETSIEEKRKWIEHDTHEKINTHMEKFADLSIEALKEKINNPARYEPEAVTAAIKLLELKSNDTFAHE